VVLGLGSGESMNEVPLGLEWPAGKVRATPRSLG
jgi:coenzyme F420-dependent glucose-6-phosphate dehydrogenase